VLTTFGELYCNGLLMRVFPVTHMLFDCSIWILQLEIVLSTIRTFWEPLRKILQAAPLPFTLTPSRVIVPAEKRYTADPELAIVPFSIVIFAGLFSAPFSKVPACTHLPSLELAPVQLMVCPPRSIVMLFASTIRLKPLEQLRSCANVTPFLTRSPQCGDP
jgi:hypothetical protein